MRWQHELVISGPISVPVEIKRSSTNVEGIECYIVAVCAFHDGRKRKKLKQLDHRGVQLCFI